MNNQQMKDALLAANTALVEKLGKQPYIRITLKLNGEKWIAEGVASTDGNCNWDWVQGKHSGTPEAALGSVMQAIAKMPSEAERDLRQFQKKVADAIDFGNEKGIEAKWVNPLVETARSLAENALTYEGA